MTIQYKFSLHAVFFYLIVFGCVAAEPAKVMTQVGDKLEMQCGDHKIVLTCGYSDEIANRQKSSQYKGPLSMCNDNTVEFIAKNGTSKKFGTYSKGHYKDSTPVRLFCRVTAPGKKFQIAVVTENSADVLRGFIAGFSEDGTVLFDEKSNHLTPPGYAYFYEMPGEAGYFDEYFKNRPRSRVLEIKEGK
jgi:hypothetical protein